MFSFVFVWFYLSGIATLVNDKANESVLTNSET